MAQAVGYRSPRDEHLEFVSPKEAARLLSVHPNTLCKWRISGAGPPFVKVGQRVRYRISEISTWTREHTFSNTAQYRLRHRDRRVIQSTR
jgi:predicted site-specific integrase-resolvase